MLPARGPRSIATRLFLSAAFWSVAVLLIAGLVLSAIYRRTAEQSFDERLGVYLRAIVADVATPGDDTRTEPGQLGDPQFELSLSGWYWQITRLGGGPLTVKASRSLFASRLPRLEELGVPAQVGGYRRGYAEGPDGRNLRIVERVIEVDEDGRYLVQVAATTDQLDQDIWRFELALAATFLILALALVGSTLLQVRWGLLPLRRLQDQVATIRRGEGERIDGTFPRDLAPLASELNLLIASNREIVERARTHVGNLAHALKTPLSVIANEAGGDTTPLADKVREQATLMRDQVNYYLDKARAAARSNVIGSATDVLPVLDGLIRTFEKIYRDREMRFHLHAEVEPKFRGEKQDLEEMVGNLLDNAGKWARGSVAITLSRDDATPQGDHSFLMVLIDDDGPGLPDSLRAEAIARGRRLDESKPGSGLGLSIVADLAAVYGGTFGLETSPEGGLRARLRLPAA
ncbi:MAG: integral rane sensor signal transduction histidine kinase [Hyphomicrobiales bacterium]|nr:integral rane sensor signal transduction histidine kinase [Hyphomicrobiales bacterium]